MRGSLSQGSSLAHEVERRIGRSWRGRSVIPGFFPVRAAVDFEAGHYFSVKEADREAERFLVGLLPLAPLTVLVEDDLGRRGDPSLGDSVLFIGDRVLRWAPVHSEGDVSGAVGLLRDGASGYPLNAYVLAGGPGVLGLQPSTDLSDARQRLLARSVRAVIVSAFDAEGFVALTRSA